MAKEDTENSKFKNHPVYVRGMSIDWIISHDEPGNNGKKFIDALVNAQNLEIYDCDTIVAIVEFLYMYYREALMRERLPPYIL
jgi:hypothetical protein